MSGARQSRALRSVKAADESPLVAQGLALQRKRMMENLSQRELAVQLGVTEQTIRKWERGGRPQARLRNTLAQYLNARDQAPIEVSAPATSATSGRLALCDPEAFAAELERALLSGIMEDRLTPELIADYRRAIRSMREPCP